MTKTKSIIYCGLFTALIAVGAFIKIPVPVVPFTLQYLFTMLAGLLLGARLGSLSVFAYMVLGLAGLPIFTESGGRMTNAAAVSRNIPIISINTSTIKINTVPFGAILISRFVPI